MYTGIAYVITVSLLVLPYLLSPETYILDLIIDFVTCAVVPIVFASKANNLWLATALIALAAAAHQGWSANVFTLVSDTFPRHAVGTVVGFGGMAGAVGGMSIAKLTGFILETTGSYMLVFLIAGSTYLVALLIVHLLMPRLDPVVLTSPAQKS